MPLEFDNHNTGALPSLERSEWSRLKASHIKAVSHWTNDRVTRANRAEPHPVYDFLFTYYSFRPAHLARWSPGSDVVLHDATASDLDWPDDFVESQKGWIIPSESFPSHRQTYLAWAIRYLEETQARPPSFCCFGLHEWAMVYQAPQPRHEQVALRLSRQEIASVVEAGELRCTHYDAYRFFTPEAAPLNRTKLTRQETTTNDQRGCIHVTMDLYRFAHKIAPWCSSEIMRGAFLLAVDARTIDMRASPYDLRGHNFDPIRIETAAGREEYIHHQRRLAEISSPIREKLLDVYRYLRR